MAVDILSPLHGTEGMCQLKSSQNFKVPKTNVLPNFHFLHSCVLAQTQGHYPMVITFISL